MFDQALLESQKTHSLGAKRLSLPVAVGLHLAVIGTFVGASAWFTGDAPEPVIPIVYPVTSTGDGPPPPPPGGGPVHHTPLTARPRPVLEMVQPPAIRIEAPNLTEHGGGPQTDSTDSPVGPGSREGIEGGTGPSKGGPALDAGKQEILPVGGDVRAPVLLTRIDPDYPEAARRAHLEGTLILEAVITASGSVQEVRVLRTLSPLLDEAAVRAVRQWRYRPATLDGRAVSVYLTVTVRFGIAS
jgi:protein TonB